MFAIRPAVSNLFETAAATINTGARQLPEEPYLVLARKWRPQAFDDVIGQVHITRTLQNAIAAGRIGHAFLFIGSRGIGKTTTARVLAKALNCTATENATPDPCGECDNCVAITAGNSMDVIEIDGASNNSVEDVRQIRENVRLVPSQSRYKIYVIDEVHQLSSSAFNALLKTLEEPPEHAVFIMATTESHKVPATIISRCQRYDFRRVSLDDLIALLQKILENETITATDEALRAIARASDGGVRDAESILEQLVTYCEKTIEFKDVVDVLGLVDWTVLNEMADAILAQDVGAALRIVEQVTASGKDLSQFVQDLLGHYRNLLICKTTDAKDLLGLPDEDLAALRKQADTYSLTQLIRLVEQFAELTKDFDSQLAQRIALESLLIRISKVSVEMSVDAVLEKLVQLGAGGLADAPSPPANTPQRSVGAAMLAEAPPLEPQSTPTEPQPSPTQPESTPSPVNSANGGITISMENLRDHWTEIMHGVGTEDLKVGVALGRAKVNGIDGDAIAIAFSEADKSSREMVSRPESLATIEAVLQDKTANIRRCLVDGTLQANPEVSTEAADAAAPAKSSNLHVAAKDAEEAMSDPHVAKVVEVFRGEIVDIRQQPRGG